MPPAASSRRLSPSRVTTPASILSQPTRHLVAESRYPRDLNLNKTDAVVDGTSRAPRTANPVIVEKGGFPAGVPSFVVPGFLLL